MKRFYPTSLHLLKALALLALPSLLLMLTWLPNLSSAQTPESGWGKPIDLFTQPDDQAGRTAVWNPRILTDSMGRAHAFWSYQMPGSTNLGDYIMYSRLGEDGVWTTPNEIIASPQGRGVSPFEVVLDKSGMFHAIWYGRSPGRDAYLYYANTYIGQADSVHGWSKPVDLLYYAGPALINPFTLVADAQGTLHLVTIEGSTQPEDFLYMKSFDQGRSWSNPVAFKGSVIPGTSFWQPRMVVDDQQRIHVAWVTEARPGETYDGHHALFYSRSEDGGLTWSEPYLLGTSFEVNYNDVNIIYDGTGTLHTVWNSSGPNSYRLHRFSTDGGRTWSEAASIYPGSGRTLWPALALDADGRVHMVSSGNAFGQGNGLFYTWWQGSSWAPITKLSELRGVVGENPQIAIGLGSVLHLVWRNDSHKAIAYIPYYLGVPPLPTQSIPTAAPSSSPTPSITAVPSPTVPVSPTARATYTQSPAPNLSNQTGNVLVGVIPVMLLLLGALFYQIMRLR